MSHVTVKLFGPEARATGRDHIDIPCDAPTTCATLRNKLADLEPQLAPLLPAARFALNHKFADDDALIEPHDEVALIGMVSGG